MGHVTRHRYKKLLYHLTALENLPGIARHGLCSRQDLRRQGLPFQDVADAYILDQRADYKLDSMVPFHFIPRNPFDYRVTHERAMDEFVILTVHRDYARAQGWQIVPRHPLTAGEEPQVLAWDVGMDEIDWHQMDRDDRDWEADHDCKMTCMAEALSPCAVQAHEFHCIFVATEVAEARSRTIFDTEIRINRNPRMFPRCSPGSS